MNDKRLFVYVLALLFAIVWASFYGGVLPYAVLFLILFYPLFAVLHAIYLQMAFRLSHGLSVHQIKKESAYPYSIVAENRGFLPLLKVRLFWEEERAMLPEELPRTLSLDPFSRFETEILCSCRYAGTYETGLLAYAISDPFGIFHFRFPVSETFRVTVRPRVTDVAASYFAAEFEKNAAIKHPFEKAETAGVDVKVYQPGDSVRRIHWRRYAREDALYVRLPEEKELFETHLFLETAENPMTLEAVKRRDRFLEFAVSAAQWFYAAGKPVVMHWSAGQLRTLMIDTGDALSAFLLRMPEEIYHKKPAAFSEAWAAEKRAVRARGDRYFVLSEAAFPNGVFLYEEDEMD